MTEPLSSSTGAAPAGGDLAGRLRRAVARAVWWPPVVVLLALLAFTLLGDALLFSQVEQHAQGVAERRAAALGSAVGARLGAQIGEIEVLARSPRWGAAPDEATPALLRADLEWLRARHPAYAWLGWLDAGGRVVAGSGGRLEGQSLAGQPLFASAQRQTFVGELPPGQASAGLAPPPGTPAGTATALPLIAVGVPVHDRAGRLLGVLAAYLDPRPALQAAVDSVLAGREPYPLQVQVIAGQPARVILQAQRAAQTAGPGAAAAGLGAGAGSAAGSAGGTDGVSAAPAQVSARLLDELARQVVPAHDEEGRQWYSGLGRLDGPLTQTLPWRLLVRVPGDAVSSAQQQLLLRVAVLAFGLALLLGLLAWQVALRTLRPWGAWFDEAMLGLGNRAAGQARPWASMVDVLACTQAEPWPLQPEQIAPLAGALQQPEQLFQQLARDAWQLKQVIEQLPLGLALSGPDLRTLYVNPAHTQLFGWDAAALLGEPLDLQPVRTEDRAAQFALLARQAREPAALGLRSVMRHQDGHELNIEWQLRPLVAADGALVGFLGLSKDISAEQRALREAAAEGHRLRLFNDAAQDLAMVMLDAEARVIDWNEGARRMKGYSAAQAMGLPLAHFFSVEDQAAQVPGRLLERVRETGRSSMEGWHLRADGSRFWSRGSLYRLPAEAAPACFAMITRDMTAAREAERRLARQHATLEELTQRLLVQEKETSRRLAQTLHDELGQTLAALRLHADLVPGLGAAPDEAAAAAPAGLRRHLRRVDGLIDSANAQVRQVLAELRPPLIDERGLWAALDNELQRNEPAAEPTRLLLRGEPQVELLRWPADVEYAAFMVAREAVFNALRHARADQVQVRLEGDPDQLVLTVSDDGCGLPDEAQPGKPGHLGLVGMHERAQAIGARLTLLSVPDHGTRVVLCWERGDPAAARPAGASALPTTTSRNFP